jgi:hypothetical protein
MSHFRSLQYVEWASSLKSYRAYTFSHLTFASEFRFVGVVLMIRAQTKLTSMLEQIQNRKHNVSFGNRIDSSALPRLHTPLVPHRRPLIDDVRPGLEQLELLFLHIGIARSAEIFRESRAVPDIPTANSHR